MFLLPIKKISEQPCSNGEPIRHTVLWEGIRTTHKTDIPGHRSPMGHVSTPPPALPHCPRLGKRSKKERHRTNSTPILLRPPPLPSLCALILLHTCPNTDIFMSSYCYTCPHTAVHVLILLNICPHPVIHLSSY